MGILLKPSNLYFKTFVHLTSNDGNRETGETSGTEDGSRNG